ncbi:hypothetical protein BV898_09389 [Hypsibius exemplaris]|uniref:Uncharacterized protein n=1 Tax=Hypsibius exemplaris TaxID=2072580 RepID=A0A1W0WMW7_HYPEX|nr:hypothetical protein BV898_09389 [Hypsibius exemplaris]
MAPYVDRKKPRLVKFDDDRSLPAYHDPSYPDSLDFLLKSVYNNATELDANKARIRAQAESGMNYFKNDVNNAQPKKDSSAANDAGPIKVAEIAHHRHENQWKCYTDSVHASQTNNGYSRQAAGGFFRWS